MIILMGERGQENIQSNLESFLNLQKMRMKIDLSKSETNKKKLKSKKKKVDNYNQKTIFNSTSSIPKKFIKEPDLSISEKEMDHIQNGVDDNEKRFEETLRRETERRENPLDLLGSFVKRIKSLCDNLQKVKLVIIFRNIRIMK